MLLSIMSDLHLEINKHYRPDVLADEKDVVLILAGDICEFDKKSTLIPFIGDMCHRFKDVVYVPGNHEYYHGHLPLSATKFMEQVNGQFDNLHFLNNNHVKIDGINIIGSTMWTSFNNANPMAMFDAERLMNDYRLIRIQNYRRLRAEYVVTEHRKAIAFLRNTVNSLSDETSIIVTHHAPSLLSIAQEYIGDSLNDAYVTELSELIAELSPSLWVHGHMHNSFDYKLYETRVVCNPRGYQFTTGKHENLSFSDSLRVVV